MEEAGEVEIDQARGPEVYYDRFREPAVDYPARLHCGSQESVDASVSLRNSTFPISRETVREIPRSPSPTFV